MSSKSIHNYKIDNSSVVSNGECRLKYIWNFTGVGTSGDPLGTPYQENYYFFVRIPAKFVKFE